MVIWVIGRSYPVPENEMEGSFELEQAKMLARYGNEVHYLTCLLHPIEKVNGKRGVHSWEEDGVQVTMLSVFFPPRVYPYYFVNRRNTQWKKLFNKVEQKYGIPDVIHIHYPAMLMIADALKVYHDKDVRVVATEHWSKVLSKKLDSIELREYKKYTGVLDKIICVGAPLANSVKELIGIDCVVVPNVVNELFKPTDQQHDGFRFVAVGRLRKAKQFDKIIEAFCDCFEGQSNIMLTIIGGGDEKDNLQRLIAERNAQNQVKMVGNQTREKTAEIVSNCDNLICYSTNETFGVPIIEAWACGISAIATTAAAVIDKFDKRLGVEVDYKDFDGLKAALKYVYKHRNEYDKTFVSSYANSRFSEASVYKRIMAIYLGQDQREI